LSDEKKPQKVTILTALVLAGSAAMMSTHLYTPSLPHLAGYFNTSPAVVKLTLSLNALAFGVSQLIHGPLSDRFGRRPVMLAGMTGFVVFNILCAFAQSISQLIAARILQGMSASVEAVLVYAVIHDLFGEMDRVRALAIYGMIIALAPAVAPIIGGYVHIWLGWRANFILIALIGLLAWVLIWRLLPESSVPDRNGMNPKRVLKNYGRLLTNRSFLYYTLMTGTGSGVIMAFVTAGPFILITYFGIATQHYGLYIVMPVLSYIIANMVTRRITGKMKIENILRSGLLMAAAGTIALAAIIFSNHQGPLSLTLAMSITTFGLGPVFAIAPMRALDCSPGPTGASSAMLNMLPMIMGGLAAVNLSVMHDGSSRPLAVTVLALLLIAVSAYGLASRISARTDGRV
jgi:DHA1 family bicyclomycin/chloramphenicol resistance-like MFS transporter